MAQKWGLQRRRAPSEILPTPQPLHPYLSGNFAPIHQTLQLTPCTYTGEIPAELAGGEYVRNGGNPVSNEDLGRDAHWFDGDGMLSGVSFREDGKTRQIHPEFVNQYILTDVYLSAKTSPRLRSPALPSIATLVNPVASFFHVTYCILRAIILVLLSHLPGSKQSIKKISVANTNIVYHDGRALATCESGPPMRVQLPSLETVGWFNGHSVEGETSALPGEELASDEDTGVFGENAGLLQFMREWTTAHPKIDPVTKEMMMFHSSFAPPYVQYSILPSSTPSSSSQPRPDQLARQGRKLLNAAVPGIGSAKMMHDFGVSPSYTVIMDLPLSLDPMNQIKGKPPVTYNESRPSRFGVFPRRRPDEVRWFETDACCIFHTANTWDSLHALYQTPVVNMLACRLTSATLVFAAGNIAPPPKPRKVVAKAPKRMPFFSKYDQSREGTFIDEPQHGEYHDEKVPLLTELEEDDAMVEYDDAVEEQCRLYYYSFSLETNAIEHQWALSTIPFEFPSVRPDVEMQKCTFVYGCSTTWTSFGAALGKATKIDALVKINAAHLIARGVACPPPSVNGCVDQRSMEDILKNQHDKDEPIRVFRMPPGWYAQEPRFVPAAKGVEEDDGYLLFYAFDESQLLASGQVPEDTDAARRAVSELWILDAKTMDRVVARVRLPQRVPYGLHGTWFSAEEIAQQRPVDSLRSLEAITQRPTSNAIWMAIRDGIQKILH